MQPGGLVRVDDRAGLWLLDEVNWDGRIGTAARPSRYLVNLLDNLGARFRMDDSITSRPTTSADRSGMLQHGSDGMMGIYPAGDFGMNVDFRHSGTYQSRLRFADPMRAARMPSRRQCWTAPGRPAPVHGRQLDAGLVHGFHDSRHSRGWRGFPQRWLGSCFGPTIVTSGCVCAHSAACAGQCRATNILLSGSSVAESLPADTLVAALTAIDPDVDDTFSYVLAAGAGSADNASFTISGNQLRTVSSFDFDAKSSYTIRLRCHGCQRADRWSRASRLRSCRFAAGECGGDAADYVEELGQRSYDVTLHFCPMRSYWIWRRLMGMS